MLRCGWQKKITLTNGTWKEVIRYRLQNQFPVQKLYLCIILEKHLDDWKPRTLSSVYFLVDYTWFLLPLYFAVWVNFLQGVVFTFRINQTKKYTFIENIRLLYRMCLLRPCLGLCEQEGAQGALDHWELLPLYVSPDLTFSPIIFLPACSWKTKLQPYDKFYQQKKGILWR